VRSLVAALSAEHGVKPLSITSWIGPSLAAYLGEKDLARMKSDARVTRITPVRRLVFSALWNNTVSPSGETTSWGTNALGGPDLSANGDWPAVYVLDAGVGLHEDLNINSADRLVTNPNGLNPPPNSVGCYSHGTHVAGIVAARQNGAGSVGVRPSTRVVSVALSVKDALGINCSRDEDALTDNNLLLGLDLIYSKIMTSRRVGIVNISINGRPENPSLFSQYGPVGMAMKNLASPLGAYPGAFIVQSAGNFHGDACAYAYDGTRGDDGIMVVGAIRANGQPVTPLNGIDGFRNESAGVSSQPGSNFGPCVEAWAPGNNILSAWGGDPQSSLPPASNLTQRLSGTSMAAPHVAALAASLAATQNLQTPAQIEAAVRARLRDLGSKDLRNRSVNLPVLSGNPGPAQPSAEFLIGSYSAQGINGNLTTYADRSFPLRYDSFGANSCILTGYRKALEAPPSTAYSLWYSGNWGTRFDWYGQNIQLPEGLYLWDVDCVSPYGTHMRAHASATIEPPAPTAHFFVNDVDTATLAPDYIFQFTPATVFGLRYSSSGTSSCNLTASVLRRDPFYGNYYWLTWYSINNFVTQFDWGNANQLNPDSYRWEVSCLLVHGGWVTASARIDVSP